jgi:uncharacterized membrane protein (GlpM family)
MTLKYILYFLIGGTVISTVTYFASHTRSLLAAFLATMPVITLITFVTIYNEVGQQGIIPYAKGLIIMLFPWGMYILSIILLSPRVGFVPALITGLTLYVIVALIILKIF